MTCIFFLANYLTRLPVSTSAIGRNFNFQSIHLNKIILQLTLLFHIILLFFSKNEPKLLLMAKPSTKSTLWPTTNYLFVNEHRSRFVQNLELSQVCIKQRIKKNYIFSGEENAPEINDATAYNLYESIY